MFKNQLQELAQRSCFNLPSYACTREGPDHAPRFKASVNFNGEIFESPCYSPTLRQAEHAAAEVALNVLSSKGPSRSLTARVLDETGIYKNLLQETAHRAGLKLPVYTTVRSGPGHLPIFTCTVELAGMSFTGEPAKTKKQAEKNAAIAAWSALKRMPNLHSLANKVDQEQDQAVVAGVLSSIRSKDESKQARKRDQNQARRRMVRGNNRENSFPSSSFNSSTNSLKHPHWRLLDLLLDSGPDGSTHKQNSFMSLLPPPPPRTTSKILPPTTSSHWNNNNQSHHQSNKPFPVQVGGKLQLSTHEIPVPVEEHQKDEEEWLGVKSAVVKKSFDKDGASSSNSSASFGSSSVYATKIETFLVDNTNTQVESRHVSGIPFGPPNPTSSTQIVRPIYTGGFNSHRLAPAVQIRSVIPVCATPPAILKTSPSAATSTTNTATTKCIETGAAAAEVVSTTRFNKADSSSSQQTQLSSELNNKLQL